MPEARELQAAPLQITADRHLLSTLDCQNLNPNPLFHAIECALEQFKIGGVPELLP